MARLYDEEQHEGQRQAFEGDEQREEDEAYRYPVDERGVRRDDVAHIVEVRALAADPALGIILIRRGAHLLDDGEGLVSLLRGVGVEDYAGVIVRVELRDYALVQEALRHRADRARVAQHARDVVYPRELPVRASPPRRGRRAGDEDDEVVAHAEGLVYYLRVGAP